MKIQILSIFTILLPSQLVIQTHSRRHQNTWEGEWVVMQGCDKSAGCCCPTEGSSFSIESDDDSIDDQSVEVWGYMDKMDECITLQWEDDRAFKWYFPLESLDLSNSPKTFNGKDGIQYRIKSMSLPNSTRIALIETNQSGKTTTGQKCQMFIQTKSSKRLFRSFAAILVLVVAMLI